MNLIRLLLEMEGYQVEQASDGLAGLEIARSDSPDLIALDLAMPVMDGWEFLREVKADAALKSIPIVAVTAHLMPRDRQRAIDAGCTGYVLKPFKVSELIGEI